MAKGTSRANTKGVVRRIIRELGGFQSPFCPLPLCHPLPDDITRAMNNWRAGGRLT